VRQSAIDAKFQQQKHTASLFNGTVEADDLAPPWVVGDRCDTLHGLDLECELRTDPPHFEIAALHDFARKRAMALPIAYLEDRPERPRT